MPLRPQESVPQGGLCFWGSRGEILAPRMICKLQFQPLYYYSTFINNRMQIIFCTEDLQLYSGENHSFDGFRVMG